MSRDVQLRQLEYLVALAREQHFGRAARSCFVSQPALSAGVQRLESELGITIVQRGRQFRGFTPEGQRVVGWAHRILAEREGLKADLDWMRGGLTSTLHIGSIPTGNPVASRLCSLFQRAHPQAVVRIDTLSSNEVTRQLSEFSLDVGLTYLDDDIVPGNRTFELYRERYLLAMPVGSPLADRDEVAWEDLAGLPLCALNPTMKNRRLLDSILAAHGVSVRPVMETDNLGALFAYVASGGVSCVVSHGWVSILGIPSGTCVRPLAEAYVPPPIGLVLPAAGSASMIAEALIDAIRDVDLDPEHA